MNDCVFCRIIKKEKHFHLHVLGGEKLHDL